MSNPVATSFGAADSALGYLQQCRLALVLLLERYEEDAGAEISIEKFDDITFENEGTPQELIQSKHHLKSSGNLTDASPDLWKTLRIWCTSISEKKIVVPGTRFTLMTTSLAPDGSASSLLRIDKRDENLALSLLLQVTNSSTSEVNKKAYEAFLLLSDEVRRELLKSITVLDSTPNIISFTPRLRRVLCYVVSNPRYIDPLLERIEGWWIRKIINHLTSSGCNSIRGQELHAAVRDLAEQFERHRLPIDFGTTSSIASLDAQLKDIDQDSRIFLAQLRLIDCSPERQRTARHDFYRASEQRAKWVREDLMFMDEIEQYEEKLSDEWHHRFEMETECLNVSSSSREEIDMGRRLYNWSQEEKIHIRSECTEPFLTRGSFHILADILRVGWHPKYKTHISKLPTKSEGGPT